MNHGDHDALHATVALVTAVRDDGGITDPEQGFVSVTTTVTHNAKLTTWLYGNANTTDASQC